MKNLIALYFIAFLLIGCKKNTEWTPCIVQTIQDGTYTQRNCNLGIDTFRIKGDSFYFRRNIRASNTWEEKVSGLIVYECDSIKLYPESYRYEYINNDWQRVKTPVVFHYSDSLTLETTKPLNYLDENFQVVSGCESLTFVTFP